MKSNSFRQAPVASNEAPVLTEKKKINWDRVFYLSLLTLICSTLGWYVIRDIFYVETTGRIVTGQFDVRFSSDVQVLSFQRQPGERVQRGDVLFHYVIADDVEQAARRRASAATTWQSDRLKVEERIARARIELAKKERLLEEVRAWVARLRRGVYLDLYTVKELDEALQREAALVADIVALREEIAMLRALLTQQQLVYSDYEVPVTEVLAQTYHAPVAGIIGELFWQPAETVFASEEVLSIALEDDEKVYIRAIFPQLEAEHLREGDVLHIRHANGEDSRGHIRRLTVPEVDPKVLPDVFETEVQAFLLAEVDPLTIEDRRIWQRLKNTRLTVSKWRF